MAVIYLSAAYARKVEMQGYATQLLKRGHDLASKWFHEPYAPETKLEELPIGTRRDIALQDLHEIDKCEYLIFFAEPSDQQPPRGGRHFEMGYALKGFKKIVVVGGRENIFHYLPEQIVAVVPTWTDALEWLRKEAAMQKEPELWGV